MKNMKKILAVTLVLFITLVNFNVVFAAPKSARTAPAVPAGLTATNVTSSEINLSWTAVSNATGYKVFRANPYDSNYVQVATISGTSFKDSGLNASTSYWYYIKSYNSYGTSNASSHLNVVTKQVITTSTAKKVLGYSTYYYSGDSSSYNSMVNSTTLIDEIGTETYTTDGLGNITGLVPTNQITYANSNGIKTLAMITNNFDGNIAKTLLESSTNRQNLINNLLSNLKLNGYKGVNVDLEGVFYYDRSYFTTFISELYNALKPQGYMVTVAVPAKTVDSVTNSWNGAYDYAQIANYADQVVIMTYDEHYPGGTPGPIASIGWVQNVANYTVTVIPKEKVLLGVAAYGYDWSTNGTKAYGISGIYNLAAANNAQIQWDSVSQSSYFKYTDSSGVAHEVWFENSTSLAYKLDVVNSKDLSGIAIWRLGLENSDYWTTIKTKFNR